MIMEVSQAGRRSNGFWVHRDTCHREDIQNSLQVPAISLVPWSPEVTLSVITFSKCYVRSSGRAMSDSQHCVITSVVLPAPR